jgi:hypothetical protein
MAETTTSIITTQGGRQYRLTHPVDYDDAHIRTAVADYLKQVEPEFIHAPNAIVQRPKPESFVQGAQEGASKVAYNVARAGETVADALGVRDPLQKFGEFINPGASSPSVNDAQANFNQRMESMPTQGSDAGKIVGEMGALAPTLALPGGVLAQGAAAGALTTDARDPVGVAYDAAKGAALSRVGEGVMRGGAALLNPQVTQPVRTLLNEGVELTPGQIVGGAVKRGEDIAATIPVVGARVAQAQQNAVGTLNRAAVNRSLRPIGERLPRDVETGQQAVAHAGDRLSAAYRDILPRLSGTLDRTFEGRVAAIDARANLPQAYQQQMADLRGELENAFTRAGPNGAYSGRTLRDTSERLGDIASAWRKNDDPFVRRLGDVAQDYRDQLHALARRQNPAEASRLRDIDRGYASLVRVEKGAAGTAEGVMTPAQYNSATRQMDNSIRRRASARGQALDQDLSGAGRTVMQNGAAQGGSKDVNSVGALLALGAGALGGRPAALAGIAGIVGGSQLYSPAALNAARMVLGRQTGPAGDALGQLLRTGARGAPITSAALLDANR